MHFYQTKESRQRSFIVRLMNGASVVLGIYFALISSILAGVIVTCLGIILGFALFCRMLKAEMRKHYEPGAKAEEPVPDLKQCMYKYWLEVFHHVTY